MLTTTSSKAISCAFAVLVAGMLAAGCAGGDDREGEAASSHSPKKLVACLAERGVPSEVEPPAQSQSGGIHLFDARGEVGAHVGGALVTIEVFAKGDNLAFYEGAAPPPKLVEAVWACAGHTPSTTP
jgi:hypothetical protein